MSSDDEITIDLNTQNQRTDPRAPVGARFAKHKIIVMSGKGGVGKSTVSSNLAISLAKRGFKTGILDLDLTGPSIPKLLGIENVEPKTDPETKKLLPILVNENLVAMSLHYFIEPDKAVIWRGSMRFKTIQNFLKGVEWGNLDYLVLDLPPGTGDEPITVAQQIPDPDGAVIVTTPQVISTQDVQKSIIFSQRMKIPVIGLVENMSGFTCPHCGEIVPIFGQNGGKLLSEEMNVPFLGSIPLDPSVSASGDKGEPFVSVIEDNEPKKAFEIIVTKIIDSIKKSFD